MKYINIAERVFNTPLAVHEGKLRIILDAISPRLGVEAPELDAALDASKTRTNGRDMYDVGGGVTVIEVNGSLVNRWATAPSGVQSYDVIRGMVRKAAADSATAGILLRIDSYGGEVSGLWDALDELAKLAKTKPIWASVDDAAYSAAYALASQAERIFVTRTGGVGSIGVIAMHYDYSGWLAKEGIKPTAIFAGARKADFSPDIPLSDEAKARLRSMVDQSYTQFVGYVETGRKLSAETIRATEADTYSGEDAVKAGLADQVGTFEEAIDAMRVHLAQRTISGTQSAATKAAAAATPQGEHMEQQPVDTAAIQAEAATAERSRIAGILNLEEAKGRGPLAQQLAQTPGITPEAAKGILAAAPVANANPLAAAMIEAPNPKVQPGAAGEGEDNVAAEVQTSLRLAGLAPKEVK